MEAMTTNPYDPDYVGDPTIVADTNSTIFTFSGKKLRFEFHVDTTLFDTIVPYKIRVKEVNGGFTLYLQQTPDHMYAHEKFGVATGVEYCFNVSMEVNESNTKAERFCFVAQ